MDLQVVLSCDGLSPSKAALVHESGLNWRIRRDREGPFIECYHPPSSRVLALAVARDGFRRYEVTFDGETVEWLSEHAEYPLSRPIPVSLPYPLEQLLVIPALARRNGFLMHAAGAAVDGKAFVFAGHSGDGKTTLSRMLAEEGLELLSDERIAIRKMNGGFMAYGTPWSGEGRVVSAAEYPLGGVLVLRKGREHRFREESGSVLAAELLSRSIVPYYFPEETQRIVALLPELASKVTLGELDFALKSGLSTVLSQIA
jgi:hypothetical protein